MVKKEINKQKRIESLKKKKKKKNNNNNNNNNKINYSAMTTL